MTLNELCAAEVQTAAQKHGLDPSKVVLCETWVFYELCDNRKTGGAACYAVFNHDGSPHTVYTQCSHAADQSDFEMVNDAMASIARFAKTHVVKP